MRILIIIAILCSFHMEVSAQNTPAELFELLRVKDSLLFTAAFSNCDISQLEKLVSTDFEFYHDKGGITPNKEKFLESIRDGLCSDTANFRSRRELVPGSLKVFQMTTNGKIYGAIQTGEHKFYETVKGQPEKFASSAKFTHLWLLEFNEWKLARVLSYDHKN